MALTACTECKKEISEQARICPSCGYAPKKAELDKRIKKALIAIPLLAIILIAIFSLSHRKPSNISDTVYKLGVDAVSIADDYLADKITKIDAVSKLETIKSRIEKEHSKDNDTYTLITGTSVLLLKVDISNEIKSDILEQRNKLAKSLNVKTIK